MRLQGRLAAGSTSEGAIGFRWQPGAFVNPTPVVALPGSTRGQLEYVAGPVFVLNTEDGSASELAQREEDGALTLVATYALPDDLADPRTLADVFEGEDLLVGDSDSVLLLHHHEDEGELEEEGHVDLEETPTLIFPVPESSFVLTGHAQGEGYHVLEITEEGLSLVGEGGGHGPVSAFGYAERRERVTRTLTL